MQTDLAHMQLIDLKIMQTTWSTMFLSLQCYTVASFSYILHIFNIFRSKKTDRTGQVIHLQPCSQLGAKSHHVFITHMCLLQDSISTTLAGFSVSSTHNVYICEHLCLCISVTNRHCRVQSGNSWRMPVWLGRGNWAHMTVYLQQHNSWALFSQYYTLHKCTSVTSVTAVLITDLYGSHNCKASNVPMPLMQLIMLKWSFSYWPHHTAKHLYKMPRHDVLVVSVIALMNLTAYNSLDNSSTKT